VSDEPPQVAQPCAAAIKLIIVVTASPPRCEAVAVPRRQRSRSVGLCPSCGLCPLRVQEMI
jgi:hypothetical protein